MWVNKELEDISPDQAKTLERELIKKGKRQGLKAKIQYHRLHKCLFLTCVDEDGKRCLFDLREVKRWAKILRSMRLSPSREKRGLDGREVRFLNGFMFLKPKPALPEVGDTIRNVVPERQVDFIPLLKGNPGRNSPRLTALGPEINKLFKSEHLSAFNSIQFSDDGIPIADNLENILIIASEGGNMGISVLGALVKAIDQDMTAESIEDALRLLEEDHGSSFYDHDSKDRFAKALGSFFEEVLKKKRGESLTPDLSSDPLPSKSSMIRWYQGEGVRVEEGQIPDSFYYVQPPEQYVKDEVFLPNGISEEDVAKRMQEVSDTEFFKSALFILGGTEYHKIGIRALAKANLSQGAPEVRRYGAVGSYLLSHEIKGLPPKQAPLSGRFPGRLASQYFFGAFEEILGASYDAFYDTYVHYENKWVEGSGTEESHALHGFFNAMGYRGTLTSSDYDHMEGMDKRSEGIEAASSPASNPLKEFYLNTYAYTQAVFQALGIKEMVLYRGARGVEECQAMPCENVRIKCRSLSSWTSNPSYAKTFGSVFKSKVPVEMIFMCPFSGMLEAEQEYVVMGASDLICTGIFFSEGNESVF